MDISCVPLLESILFMLSVLVGLYFVGLFKGRWFFSFLLLFGLSINLIASDFPIEYYIYIGQSTGSTPCPSRVLFSWVTTDSNKLAFKNMVSSSPPYLVKLCNGVNDVKSQTEEPIPHQKGTYSVIGEYCGVFIRNESSTVYGCRGMVCPKCFLTMPNVKTYTDKVDVIIRRIKTNTDYYPMEHANNFGKTNLLHYGASQAFHPIFTFDSSGGITGISGCYREDIYPDGSYFFYDEEGNLIGSDLGYFNDNGEFVPNYDNPNLPPQYPPPTSNTNQLALTSLTFLRDWYFDWKQDKYKDLTPEELSLKLNSLQGILTLLENNVPYQQELYSSIVESNDNIINILNHLNDKGVTHTESLRVLASYLDNIIQIMSADASISEEQDPTILEKLQEMLKEKEVDLPSEFSHYLDKVELHKEQAEQSYFKLIDFSSDTSLSEKVASLLTFSWVIPSTPSFSSSTTVTVPSVSLCGVDFNLSHTFPDEYNVSLIRSFLLWCASLMYVKYCIVAFISFFHSNPE